MATGEPSPILDELTVGSPAQSIRTQPRNSAPTTTKQRSAVEQASYDANIGTGLQLAFPGFGVESFVAKRRRATTLIAITKRDANLLDEFARRLRRRYSEATARQYAWVLKDLTSLAGTLSGRTISLEQLFTKPDLLGRTLARGTDSKDSRMISAWLASQRRSVLRSFALLLEQELEALGISDPSGRVTQVLQATAEPIGSGYRLPVGWPRGRGGPMPSDEDADAIREAISDRPGWSGNRNAAFLAVLASRGQRVGALLRLDGSNLHRLPDGRVRMLLHAKSSREPFEVVLPAEALNQFEAYIVGFNYWAQATSLPQRIGFGLPGTFWRDHSGKTWTYEDWSRELSEACLRAGVPRVTAHGFRRAFASRATTFVPRSLAALAGNWSSPRRMDDHYVQPSLTRLRRQLSNIASETIPDSAGVELPTLAKVD